MATNNEIFVTELFRDLFYRTPTPAELSFYASRLDTGFYTRSQVAAQFMTSTDYKDGLESLARLYRASFDRIPDIGGLTYWNGILRQGASFSDIANIFFFSPEFIERYGANLTNEQFVTILYQNVLDRTPDAGGQEFWNKVLKDGTGRGQVLASFAQSAELKQKLATETKMIAAYAVIAKREPYAHELTDAPNTLEGILVNAVSAVSSELTWNTVGFNEAALNDGSFAESLTVRITGGTFKGVAGTKLGTVTNVPAGLTANLVKVNDTEAKLTLTGKATTHTAAVSITNLTVTFSQADFATGGLPYNIIKSDLKVNFTDLFAYVNNDTLSISIAPNAALVIDLTTDSLKLGGTTITPITGAMVDAVNANLSGIPAATTTTGSTSTTTTTTKTTTTTAATTTTATVSFKAGPEDNTYFASPLGDTITPGGGNDILVLGAGVDTIFMPADPAGGLTTISGFKPGTGGDILKFGNFLNTTKVSNVTPVDTNIAAPATPRAWNNGDVVLVIGNLNENSVVELFGKFLANPASASKLVILSADVTGNTKIWYVTNYANTGLTGGAGSEATRISANEVQLVGVLEQVNNLDLAGFLIGNFG